MGASVAAAVAGIARPLDASDSHYKIEAQGSSLELQLPKATEAVTQFKVAVPEPMLQDLHRRLGAVRWPSKETAPGWGQGVPLAKAQGLVEYWKKDYQWRRFEAHLNSFPQYRTLIDGVGIHFLHVRSKHESALPILLTHGWPGSVVEFLKTIGPLTDPEKFGGSPSDAFHVVIPSLPGFGFSDKPEEAGWDLTRIAKAWSVLMDRLGYKRWVAQGGDWGSGVTHRLAIMRPSGLVAAHVNWPFVFPEKLPDNPNPAEQLAIEDANRFYTVGGGYYREQTTRPQTISYPLADSPSGQALWIYEKFQEWTDNNGNPEDALTVDEMLDNIMIYWLTNTAGSSARIYQEDSSVGSSWGRIELPMAASIFPHEIFRAPKQWAEQAWPNMFYWNEVSKGGHFAAFEQPQIFSEELRKAFRKFQQT